MLSELILCTNPDCKQGIETKDGTRHQCPVCKGKGYTVDVVKSPPGADFFAQEDEG